MARIITGCFAGPAGRLEYILSEPEWLATVSRAAPVGRRRAGFDNRPGEPAPLEAPPSGLDENAERRAAVVCHPHPQFGGTMHTKVVFQTSKVLLELGLPVLRFNFRGVGKSQGSYDHGQGEQRDLEAAIAFVRETYPWPLIVGGFSFGATIVAKLLAEAPPPDIAGAVLLGLPVEARDRGEIPSDWQWQGPKLLISGAQDQFASVAELERYFAALAPPKARAWIPGADHFMTGQMEAFRAALGKQLSEILK